MADEKITPNDLKDLAAAGPVLNGLVAAQRVVALAMKHQGVAAEVSALEARKAGLREEVEAYLTRGMADADMAIKAKQDEANARLSEAVSKLEAKIGDLEAKSAALMEQKQKAEDAFAAEQDRIRRAIQGLDAERRERMTAMAGEIAAAQATLREARTATENERAMLLEDRRKIAEEIVGLKAEKARILEGLRNLVD
jgi:hypothetical protein